MDFEVVGLNITVPLSEKQWDKLMEIEKAEEEDEFDIPKHFPDAYNIDFNGHFGRNFYFDCKTHNDAIKTTTLLESLLGNE